MNDELDEIALNVLLADDVSLLAAIAGSTKANDPGRTAPWVKALSLIVGAVVGLAVAIAVLR
jgi:hypothetical protein